jgi:hypothetical protein
VERQALCCERQLNFCGGFGKMKKLILLLLFISLVCAVNAATIRYQGSGAWSQIAPPVTPPTTPPTYTGTGWQGVAPGTADVVRANWGGAVGNLVTLNYTTTVSKFEAGADESGTFEIQNGGNLTGTSTNRIGITDRAIGTTIGEFGAMNVLTGGTVNNGSWLKVGAEINADGFLTVSGTVNIQSHLWVAAASGSKGTVVINNGGVVKTIAGNLGIGTGNASTPSGGTGSITVNSGGFLDLWQWSATTSIATGSVLNINGTGVVKVMGNRGTQADAYFALGKIASDKGGIQWVYTPGAVGQDYTTITAIPEPMTMSLLGLGALALLRKKR